MTDRESLDTNDKLAEHSGPTKEKTELNLHPLHCRTCGDVYHVDDATYERVSRAVEFDPSENPFSCPRCEDEYADEERR